MAQQLADAEVQRYRSFLPDLRGWGESRALPFSHSEAFRNYHHMNTSRAVTSSTWLAGPLNSALPWSLAGTPRVDEVHA